MELNKKQDKAIKLDDRLDDGVRMAQEDLAKHRWHWTLDESNDDRMSLRSYAAASGKAFATVQSYANGYAASLTGPPGRSLADEIALANMGADKQIVAAAVANVEGVTVSSVASRRGGSDSLANLKAMAEEVADREKITLEAAAKSVAERRKKTKIMAENKATKEKAAHTRRYLSIEAGIAKAKSLLIAALKEAEGVGFVDDELEMLRDSIGTLKSVLTMLDVRVGGESDTDWDRELANLTSGGSS
jgi:hypothetical protein